MAESTTEKSPIDRTDYEGLQLDTRAKDETEKSLSPVQDNESVQSPQEYRFDYHDEKAMIAQREFEEARRNGVPMMVHQTSNPTNPVDSSRESEGLEAVVPAPQPRVQRICGLRQRHFWISFCSILAIIIVAAVIGGIAAKTRRGSSSSPSLPATSSTPSSTPSNPSNNPPLTSSDVVVGSPLQLASYNESVNTSSTGDDQAIRLYYQSLNGAIKEMRNDQSIASWQPAKPIFTDAINNTGLAVISYLNGTIPQSSIFYVGQNLYIQEKRNYPDQPYWEPSPKVINSQNIPAVGRIRTDSINGDPQNSFDSYRMAAAYSTNFYNGSEGRLFLHQQATNGTSWVQEMVWSQGNDSWAQGHQFTDAWPNSHIAVTVDESSQTLRLFFSIGSLTLQEYFLNISDPNGTYNLGINLPNILAHNDADIAVVSTRGDTYLYYYADNGTLSIREVNITGPSVIKEYQSIAGSSCETCGYNASNFPVVAHPALVSGNQQAIYQPIGATVSTVSNEEPVINVFWAEQNTSPNSGYGVLATVSRKLNGQWSQSSYGSGQGQLALPLGDQ